MNAWWKQTWLEFIFHCYTIAKDSDIVSFFSVLCDDLFILNWSISDNAYHRHSDDYDVDIDDDDGGDDDYDDEDEDNNNIKDDNDACI